MLFYFIFNIKVERTHFLKLIGKEVRTKKSSSVQILTFESK